MAAMLLLRQTPRLKGSDTQFQAKANQRMESMDPNARRRLLEVARRNGIDTTGKYYCGGLGKANDPEAWVSGTSDILRVAKKRNLTVTGSVEHQGVETPPKPQVPLAPDLVREMVVANLQKDPALKEKCKKNPKKIREVQEAVVEKYAPKRKKQ